MTLVKLTIFYFVFKDTPTHFGKPHFVPLVHLFLCSWTIFVLVATVFFLVTFFFFLVTSILPIWNYSICTFLVLVSRIFYLWYIICFFVASIFVLVATIFFLVTFFFFLSNFNITNLRWLNLYLSHLFLCKGSNAPQKLFPIVFSCYLFRFGASDIREPFIVLFFFFFLLFFFFFFFSLFSLFCFCFCFVSIFFYWNSSMAPNCRMISFIASSITRLAWSSCRPTRKWSSMKV